MRFRQTLAFLFCFLFVGAVLAVPAQSEVKIGEAGDVTLFTEIHAVGGVQALEQENNNDSIRQIDPSFHTAYANMDWRITLDDYAELFFDVTQASRVKNDRWWGHEGYMRIERFPEGYPPAMLNPMMRYVDLKIGHFDVNYGWYPETSSINADVQRNPLIGNSIVRPLGTEAGLEVYGDEFPVKWMFGFGQGTSTEDFNQGKSLSAHAKVWGNVTPGVELALSGYRLDDDEQSGRGPGHVFSTERIGGRYGGVWGGGADANVLPGQGFDVTGYQLDLRTTPTENLSVNALYGIVEDADANGAASLSPEESWNHYAVDATYDLTENIYLASRYSAAEVDKVQGLETVVTGTKTVCTDFDKVSGTCSNTDTVDETSEQPFSSTQGTVNRIQLGMGMQIFEGFLGKLEYVKQEASDFEQNVATGADLRQDPEFDGVIAEFSMKY